MTLRDNFHAGIELSDECAEEKLVYDSYLADLIDDDTPHPRGRWEGREFVVERKSHRTSAIWEMRSLRAPGGGLELASAIWKSKKGPNFSPTMKRAYRGLGYTLTLPDAATVTGEPYLARCEHQLPVYPGHPSNHAHLAGATGIVMADMADHFGIHNGAFVTLLLDAVPVTHPRMSTLCPTVYRSDALRRIADNLSGYTFYICGFDEAVVRRVNSTQKQRKETQFVDDHIAANAQYQKLDIKRWKAWFVPHIHFVIFAVKSDGKVLPFSQLRAALSGLKNERHALQIKTLVGRRSPIKGGDKKRSAATVLDYSNKRYSKLGDADFLRLIEWHAKAPVSGVFDALVMPPAVPMSPGLRDLENRRERLLKIVKMDRLHQPSAGTLAECLDWFEEGRRISHQYYT